MKLAILGHLTITNPTQTPTATAKILRYAARLMLTPAPGWWREPLTLRFYKPSSPARECDRETHERNLASNAEMMWTFGGMNYWRLEGRLYARRNRSDVERGISQPLTVEERREAGRLIWLLRGLIAAALLCHAVAIWLAFGGWHE